MSAVTKPYPILLSFFVLPLVGFGQQVQYSITSDSFAPLAGNSSSTSYAQFSAVEPIGGAAAKDSPDFINFIGFIGQLPAIPPLDQDNDGIPDKEEIVLGTNINNADSDGDGLTDGEEVTLGTNPTLADSDNDGYSDYLEINSQTDPLAASSNPNQAPVIRGIGDASEGTIEIQENNTEIPSFLNFFSQQHPYRTSEGSFNASILDQFSKSLNHTINIEYEGDSYSLSSPTPWNLLSEFSNSPGLPLLKPEDGFNESTTIDLYSGGQATMITDYNGTSSVVIDNSTYQVHKFKFTLSYNEPHIAETYFEKSNSSEVLIHDHLGVLGYSRNSSEIFYDYAGSGELQASQQSSGSVTANVTGLGGINAYDPDGDQLNWVLAEFGDYEHFSLTQTSRLGYLFPSLSFKSSPDFENPQDIGEDNKYEIVLVATDGRSSTDFAINLEIKDTSEDSETNNPDNEEEVVDNEEPTTPGDGDELVDNDDTNNQGEEQISTPLIVNVSTLKPTLNLRSATLYGKVTSYSDHTPLMSGFIISQDILFQNPDTVMVVESESFSEEINATVSDLTPGETYYTRAFASFENDDDKIFGTIQRIRIQKPLPDFFDGFAIEAGWYESEWFGNFKRANENWVYHTDLEWLYVASSSPEGSWLWSEKFGWGWTRKDLWPYIWTNSPEGWLYFFGNQQGTLTFWNYTKSGFLKL